MLKSKPESKPKLYIFAISHYCEKARWALDYHNLDVTVCVVAPGEHVKIAKKLGLKRGSVPFLTVGDSVIQGSNNIVDWAEQHSEAGRSLGSNHAQALAIERRLDSKLGVHLRRWFYSEAVIEYPETVRPIFMLGQTPAERVKLWFKWPVIRKLMIKAMNLGLEQGQESYKIVMQELAWLESLIDNKDSFLIEQTFSRADITAASLLAPVVNPRQHSYPDLLTLPPRVEQQAQAIKESRVWAWVEQQYALHRHE